MSDPLRNQYRPFIFIVLALAYVITGKLGLMLALPPGYASAIFPPSGIALAGAYLAGRTALPWIFLGSLLLNIWVGYSTYHHISETSLITALIIAFASTLQAAIGGWGLTRAIGFQSRFDQVSDVLHFLLIVPLVCLTSATLSVSGLVTMSVIDMNGFINGWLAWWAGDTLGALVLFPICLVFAARPHRVWRKRRLWVALPMLLALVLAIISFILGSKWEENNALMEFRALSDQIKGQIITRLDLQEMLLMQTRAFFLHVDKQPNRDEFNRYMQTVLAHFNTIQAIEWAPRIEDSQRNAFEAEQRKELPNYEIRERDASGQLIPAQHRPNYYPVTYLEPIMGNQPALGLDLAFSPERKEALAKAISQNKLVSTPPIHLVQDKTNQAAILLIYSITEQGSSSGVVLTVLKMRDFVEKLLPENRSILFIRLVDVEAHKNLYNNFTSDSTEPLTSEHISFGKRQYRLEIAPTSAYWAQHQGLQSYGILAVGLFGIGALGCFLLLGTGYTSRVEIKVKEQTRELQESEKRFRTMADSVPVLIWLSGTDKLCSWFNKVWLDFTGRTLEQELGNGWAEGVHPDDLQHCLDTYIDHFDHRQPFTMEYRLKRHDGEYRWVSDSGIPRYDNEGMFEGYIGSCIDITERKQTEEIIASLNEQLKEKLKKKIRKQTSELKATNLSLLKKVEELRHSRHQLLEREAKLNAIFNASVEGIITIDMSDIIVSANAAVETIFGYKPEELVGGNINKLIPLSPREMNYYSSPHTVESIGQIQEIEGIHKSGFKVPLDMSIAEFAIDNLYYFTTIVRDVSLRKYREQQDREHLDELAHVTRLGLMGEMASGIAHEVNQPLTAISSYTQVSLNLINTENPDLAKLTEILYKTQQQALRAGQIIHRMREFVKSHTKHRSTADVNSLIYEAVSLCIAELKQNNIRLRFELENNLPLVSVDHIQIEQVIINLIRNSIDALQSQPEKQQRHLAIQSYWTSHNGIEVRIKDNGPGLDENQQQKILTPFYTTKSDGMGMGLSICRSLINAHDGTFHFNSQPGKGTTFYFTLPLSDCHS